MIKKRFKQMRTKVQNWYNNRYCIQMWIPEYNGYHVCKTLTEMLQWQVCYPADCNILIVYPLKSLKA